MAYKKITNSGTLNTTDGRGRITIPVYRSQLPANIAPALDNTQAHVSMTPLTRRRFHSPFRLIPKITFKLFSINVITRIYFFSSALCAAESPCRMGRRDATTTSTTDVYVYYKIKREPTKKKEKKERTRRERLTIMPNTRKRLKKKSENVEKECHGNKTILFGNLME